MICSTLVIDTLGCLDDIMMQRHVPIRVAG